MASDGMDLRRELLGDETQAAPPADGGSLRKDVGVQDQPTVAAPPAKTFGQELGIAGKGVVEGARELADPQIEWLAKHGIIDNPLTRWLGAPTTADYQSAHAQRKGEFDKQYGDDTYAQVGKVAGDIGGLYLETLPISMMTGPLAAALRAPRLIAQAPQIVKTLGGQLAQVTPAARVAVQAGPAARAAATGVDIASGAAQGAAGSALEGGDPTAGAVWGGLSYPVGRGIEAIDKYGINPLLHLGGSVGTAVSHALMPLLKVPDVLTKYGGRLIANTPQLSGALGGQYVYGGQ